MHQFQVSLDVQSDSLKRAIGQKVVVSGIVMLNDPGQPVEMSPLSVLLASRESSYVTGEVYGVTGGLEIS